MKHILTFGLFLFLTLKSFAQTDGISYQAVIIAPDVLELPGVNSEGNYLPNATVIVRFIIFDSGNQIEFQEDQTATTDDFGRINLIIGAVNHDDFEKISWDGTPKDLKVEIDFQNGSSFVDMSREILTFVPYAYHRNITATGTLDVDGDTFLNRELTVNGPTILNSTLLVSGANETNLTGDLTVDGVTNLNNDLNVNNQSTTNLSGALNVGVATGLPDPNAPTVLNGDLTVVGQSAFTGLTVDDLTVNIKTLLKGDVDIDTDQQVTITSTTHTANIDYTSTNDRTDQVIGVDPGKNINNYPLLVEGSTQGIAIKVLGSRRNGNNFVSFWDDDTNAMWGRIEGEVDTEFANNADYVFDKNSLDYDVFDGSTDYAFALIDAAIAGANLGAALADVRPCAGLGACVTSPGPLMIAAAIAEVAIVGGKIVTSSIALANSINNRTIYDNNKMSLQGVTYASGSGDYAEYLLRSDINESMTYGDIVAVNGGKITKNTENAEKMMVVSHKPIVLGNMPQKNDEAAYEKVAFMGQVPVKVFGKVKIGDYIIPSGKNDGIGIAISPSKIKIKNVNKIVGIAWSNSESIMGFNMINVAVGLNTNDNNLIVERLEHKVATQQNEISNLKNQMANILIKISELQNDSSAQNTNTEAKGLASNDGRKYEIINTDHGDIIYFELTKNDVYAGLELAERQMIESGIDINNNKFWKKIKTDTNFKEEFVNKIMAKFDKQMHYHKNLDKRTKN